MKKEKKGNITIYHVSPIIENDKIDSVIGKQLKRDQITTIINENADVYTTDGVLLLKFRKNVLSSNNMDDFYENIIGFANITTNNRGMATTNQHTRTKEKSIYTNAKVKSNIFGYYDSLSVRQKHLLTINNNGKKLDKMPFQVRETRFTRDYPEKYAKTIPLVEEISEQYRKLIPDKYAIQLRHINETPYRIGKSVFSTVTTNVNFQTSVHQDAGDLTEGFGNLTVLEHGEYEGGETCFPQYGIGINVRMGDIIMMDVHQPHGNLPIVLKSKDAVRLSIVCYLREKLWRVSRGKSKAFMERHIKQLRTMLHTTTKKNKTKTNNRGKTQKRKK